MHSGEAYISVSLLLPPFSSKSVSLANYNASDITNLIRKLDISATPMHDVILFIFFTFCSKINSIDLFILNYLNYFDLFITSIEMLVTEMCVNF